MCVCVCVCNVGLAVQVLWFELLILVVIIIYYCRFLLVLSQPGCLNLFYCKVHQALF